MHIREIKGLLSSAALATLAAACSDAGDVRSDDTDSATSGITAAADVRALYDGDRAFALAESIVALGPRVAGGPEEAAAAALIAGRFEELGLRVSVEQFPVMYYLDHGATLGLTGASLSDVQANPLRGSLPGVISAPLMNCGTGNEMDQFPVGQSGYIALVTRGVKQFIIKAQNAYAAGAAAVIISNDRPGPFTGNAYSPPLPVVGISQADGNTIRADLQQGPVNGTLVVNTVREDSVSRNVVATLDGTAQDAGKLYIGAHYDSVEDSPGANDNAVSVGVVLEAARVLSTGHRGAASIEFVAFGAEEPGKLGSIAFTAAHQAEIQASALGMINQDMVGLGSRLQIGNTAAPLALVDYARSKATAMDLLWEAAITPALSDHAPFEALGIPTLMLYRVPADLPTDPCYHTPLDTMGRLDPALAEQVGELTAGVAYDWAKNPPLRERKQAALLDPDCRGVNCIDQ